MQNMSIYEMVLSRMDKNFQVVEEHVTKVYVKKIYTNIMELRNQLAEEESVSRDIFISQKILLSLKVKNTQFRAYTVGDYMLSLKKC